MKNKINEVHMDLGKMSLHDFALEVLRLVNLRSNNDGIIDVQTVYGTNELIVKYDPVKINRENLIWNYRVIHETNHNDTSE